MPRNSFGTNHWQDWMNLILAIWLFISPWVLQFASGAATVGTPAEAAAAGGRMECLDLRRRRCGDRGRRALRSAGEGGMSWNQIFSGLARAVAGNASFTRAAKFRGRSQRPSTPSAL
jgi:hypothetical protein